MSRCPGCGWRVRGPHPGCALLPLPAPRAPAVSLPDVPGYQVSALLGHGGFAVVLAAERVADGTRVALKVARAEVGAARDQLDHEAYVLDAVGPPAVPALLGRGVLRDGTPFLVLELVEGPSLAARLLESSGRLSRAELGPTALAVVDAVAQLHAVGFAHGDLKPENVLLDQASPRARLVDLALAERLAGGGRPGGFAGSAEYLAPERCQGFAPDERSDVYALGAILLELTAGRPPFFGSDADVRHAQVNLRPPCPTALGVWPAGLAKVIERCLAKAPGDRFPSADALREALRAALLADAAPAVMPATSAQPVTGRAVRRSTGAVFLETDAHATTVQAAVTAMGGTLAHAEGHRCVVVFDAGSGENPVELALRAADRVFAMGLAPTALVDLVPTLVRPRPGGGDRYLSDAFHDPRSWPRVSDPTGVLVTKRAAEVLVGVALDPVPVREGLRRCPRPRAGADRPTVVRDGAPPLLGRDDVLERLVALAQAAGRDRSPTAVAVIGDPGMGKSHLAAVLADRLRASVPEPAIVELRARPSLIGEDALGALLRELIHVPAQVFPPDGGRALLRLALPADVADEAWPAVSLSLGWIPPDSPVLRPAAAAPGALPGLAARAAALMLRLRAAARPVCVLFDDAHLAGGALLDALETAALAEYRTPIFICALARPDFMEARPRWGDRAAHRSVERLDPLPSAIAAELCARLLAPAEGIPAQAIECLAARGRGVPLLLVELVRGLRREGLVRVHGHGRSSYVATDELDRLPELPVVEWIAGAQLRGMPPELASHAQLAALLGDEILDAEAGGVLAELSEAGQGGAYPLDAAAASRRLVSRGLMVRHRDGSTSFRVPLVRETVARTIPEALRRAIHEAAFRFYARSGAPPDLARLARQAVHAEGAGRKEDAAAGYLWLAADRAGRHAYLEAEGLYSRALENLAEGKLAQRLTALRGRGLARSRVGRHRDAVEDLTAAAAAARGLDDRDALRHALLDWATALDWMSDFGAARERVEEAAAVPGPLSPLPRGRLALGRGRSLFRSSRWEGACAALEDAAALGASQDDDGYETLVAALLLLGAALPYLGRAGEAEAALERARGAASVRGDLVHVAVAHLNGRNLLVSRGDLAAAVHGQRQAIRIARDLGHLDSEYYASYNLAELHYLVGDLRSAGSHLARAEEIERAHPEAAPGPVALLLRARMLLWSGDAQAARDRLERYREARASGWSGSEIGPSEAVLADVVDLATRPADDGEWSELLDRSARDSIEQEPIEVLELRGLAGLRAGRVEVGRAALAEALRLGDRGPGLLSARIRRELATAMGSAPAV